MSGSTTFLAHFDSEGRYRPQDGTVDVVFAVRGGGRYPGKLTFRDGLCVRAELLWGTPWENADQPLSGLTFLLHLGDESPLVVAIDQGRVIGLGLVGATPTKGEFLWNLRIARNLLHRPQATADNKHIDSTALVNRPERAAIWLTPKSVAGFNPASFVELRGDRVDQLSAAVKRFLAVATQVPPNKPPTSDQYQEGKEALEIVLALLDHYLPVDEENKKIEGALTQVDFPEWVINWDFELDSDASDQPAVWINLFIEEDAVKRRDLGRTVLELTERVHQALAQFSISRWPYIRVKTAQEFKVG